jgi:thiol-disulfide isomerase/thioredoxin
MKKYILALLAWIYCLSPTTAPAASSGPVVGTLAPDFKARNILTGESIPLSSQRGKIVILTFWASWCGPCRRELPILENAQQLVGKDKMTVFAVSYRESPDAQPALRKLASAVHINIIEDRNSWIAGHYAISGIPHLFLIDREGKVVANHLGYGDRSLQELVADINHALTGSMPVERDTPPAAPTPESAPAPTPTPSTP